MVIGCQWSKASMVGKPTLEQLACFNCIFDRKWCAGRDLNAVSFEGGKKTLMVLE